MRLLHSALTSGASSVFENNDFETLTIHARGTADEGDWGDPSEVTLDLQISPDGILPYVDLYQDGAVLSLTSTNNVLSLTPPGGVFLRLNANGGESYSVDIYVGGAGVVFS